MTRKNEKRVVRGDKRLAILTAAVELFAKRGVDGVSLRDIADRSGFQLGSIYHFYPQKRQLYEEAVTLALQNCADLVVNAIRSPAVADMPADRKLHRFVTTLFKLLISESPDIRLLDRENLGHGTGYVPDRLRTPFLHLTRVLKAILKEMAGGRQPAIGHIDWLSSHVVSLIYGAAKLHPQHVAMLGIDSERKLNAFLSALTQLVKRAISQAR